MVTTIEEAIMIKEPIIPSCMKAAKFEVSPLKKQLSINVDDVEKLVVKTMHFRANLTHIDLATNTVE